MLQKGEGEGDRAKNDGLKFATRLFLDRSKSGAGPDTSALPFRVTVSSGSGGLDLISSGVSTVSTYVHRRIYSAGIMLAMALVSPYTSRHRDDLTNRPAIEHTTSPVPLFPRLISNHRSCAHDAEYPRLESV